VSDIMSILQSAYAAAPQPLIPPGAKLATNVNPTQYQGTWTGKDANNQPFSLSITKVSGPRANVTFQSASGGLQFARAFITSNNTFEIGDSQFQLTGTGTAVVKTVVTNPNNGTQTVQEANATLKT
jgi:hypothetical protein